MNDQSNLNSAGTEDISLFKKLCSHIGLSLIIMVISLLVLLFVSSFLYAFITRLPNDNNTAFLWFTQIIITIPAILLACDYLSKKTNQKIKPLFQLKEKFNFLDIINYFPVIILFSTCSRYFLILVDKILPKEVVSSTAPDLSIPQNSILANIFYFIAICIVPPIFEELLFRGVILGSLRKYGNWFSIIISSILFSLFHGNLYQIIGVLPIGIILGILTIKTNSILPSIILHFINNLFVVGSNFIISTENVKLIAILGFTSIGIILLGLIILLSNRQIFILEKDTPFDIPTMKKYKLFFLSIPVIIYILYIIVNIGISIAQS